MGWVMACGWLLKLFLDLFHLFLHYCDWWLHRWLVKLVFLANCNPRTNHLIELQWESWLSFLAKKLLIEPSIVRVDLISYHLFDCLVVFSVKGLLCWWGAPAAAWLLCLLPAPWKREHALSSPCSLCALLVGWFFRLQLLFFLFLSKRLSLSHVS